MRLQVDMSMVEMLLLWVEAMLVSSTTAPISLEEGMRRSRSCKGMCTVIDGRQKEKIEV